MQRFLWRSPWSLQIVAGFVPKGWTLQIDNWIHGWCFKAAFKKCLVDSEFCPTSRNQRSNGWTCDFACRWCDREFYLLLDGTSTSLSRCQEECARQPHTTCPKSKRNINWGAKRQTDAKRSYELWSICEVYLISSTFNFCNFQNILQNLPQESTNSGACCGILWVTRVATNYHLGVSLAALLWSQYVRMVQTCRSRNLGYCNIFLA